MVDEIIKRHHQPKESTNKSEPVYKTVREMLVDYTEQHNRQIEKYMKLYMDLFYEKWRAGMRYNICQTNGQNTVFVVGDVYNDRPIESWELFLEEVLSNHPDKEIHERKSNGLRDGRTEYVFDYKNCLDDKIPIN